MNEQSDGAAPQAFDAVREREARLRTAIEASGLGTFIWQIDADCVEKFGPADACGGAVGCARR